LSKYLIIVNPISGRGAGEKSIPAIRLHMESLQLPYELLQTERPGHAIELAESAALAGYEAVIGVGGDGTANEIINGLMRTRQSGGHAPAMGMLAVGRGNDFAFGAGIPAGLEAGFKVLTSNYRKKIDIGRATGGDYPRGRYFGNGVGIGFDAVVGFEALKMTRLTGFLSYIVAALKTIFLYYHAPTVRIEYDGESLELPALMVSIMNGRRMGGGFMMAPDASPADGLLDLCIARQVSRGRIFALIPHFLKGDQATQEPIRTARARQVQVTALAGALPAHADGETLCEAGEQLSIELLPAQLELICQAPQVQL
jgi:YegS/Rv2252/BmrU family lipid kinase